MPKAKKENILPGAKNSFILALEQLRNDLKAGSKKMPNMDHRTAKDNKDVLDNFIAELWPIYNKFLKLSKASVDLIAIERRTSEQEKQLNDNLTTLLSLTHTLVNSINNNPTVREAVADSTQMKALETLLSPQGRQLFGNLILEKGHQENRYRTDRTLRSIEGIGGEATVRRKEARTREKTYNALKYISCLLVVTAPLGLLFHSKSKKYHEKVRKYDEDNGRLNTIISSLNGRPQEEGDTRAITGSADDIKNGVAAIQQAITSFSPPALPLSRPRNA